MESWLAKTAGSVNDGDMTYDNSSRMESKRFHQWFMDSPEVDLFPRKKQAIEVSSSNLLSGMYSTNNHSWGNSSRLHSFNGHFSEQLYEPEASARALSCENRNISPLNADKLTVGQKDNMEPFGSNSSFITQTIDDHGSGINYGGIRKVKISEVKDSENVMSVPSGHTYDMGVNNTVSNAHVHRGGDYPTSTSLACDKGDDNVVSVDDDYGRAYNNFISICQSYSKEDGGLSVGQTYKETRNTISMGQAFSKEDGNMLAISQAYNKPEDNSISRQSIFNKGEDGTMPMNHAYHQDRNNKLSIAYSYNNGESTIISFGGCDDDDGHVSITPSGRLISNYELLMGQPPVQSSEAVNERELIVSNPGSSLTSASVTGNVSHTKEESKISKKFPSNNFPSNVRSLLSTGMLDGVPVKYMAWSREELRGVIKGSGYLCSCQSCNYSKVINAYEFERHAGRKTKHPNNHIYFENGKTIYGIVQELRSTPQNMLFDVIQTITGSPINQKSFRIWKESFLAATRELQRIYGKDEMKHLS
ncbi:uncharacterized protein LOC114717268 isoform X2 [Neltuma alba]|uniref:uncharacterized protein LOC114717268 isoform X2 n=1 Tax=Neltuma alba TaxID=207710 RepID=UPI0010A3607B|nr:uncharacterized protein LOC114717268 isoform X2 [Prosopis alba]